MTTRMAASALGCSSTRDGTTYVLHGLLAPAGRAAESVARRTIATRPIRRAWVTRGIEPPPALFVCQGLPGRTERRRFVRKCGAGHRDLDGDVCHDVRGRVPAPADVGERFVRGLLPLLRSAPRACGSCRRSRARR